MTTQTDIARNPKDWDGRDSRRFTIDQILFWSSGVALGCFIGAFITLAVINIFDPPCTMQQIYKVCKTHGGNKNFEHGGKEN